MRDDAFFKVSSPINISEKGQLGPKSEDTKQKYILMHTFRITKLTKKNSIPSLMLLTNQNYNKRKIETKMKVYIELLNKIVSMTCNVYKI